MSRTIEEGTVGTDNHDLAVTSESNTALEDEIIRTWGERNRYALRLTTELFRDDRAVEDDPRFALAQSASKFNHLGSISGAVPL